MGRPIAMTSDQPFTSPLRTIPEVAQFLRVSPRTVARLVAGQALPVVRVYGRTLVHEADLQAFVAKASSRGSRARLS